LKKETLRVVVCSLLAVLACIGLIARTGETIEPDAASLFDSLDFDKLLFVRRYTFQSSHYYTDFIDGCRKFGGNISILSLKDGSVTDLVPSMNHGIFGRCDLSFDGKRVVFGWKEAISKGFRIYEVGIDGKSLRQLTFDPPDEQQRVDKYRQRDHESGKSYMHHTDDMHPCYLPDGGICFTSTRCEYGILCDAPDFFTTCVLYRMDADGGNIQKLTNSAVSEFAPTVMNDGRILYHRWEYIDKGHVNTKCLWAMRPDGTGSVEIYGNDIAWPPGFTFGRAIPGHDNLFVCIGVGHGPLAVGTVIRIDTSRDLRTREPMTYITPDLDIRGEGGFWRRTDDGWDEREGGPFYIDPYPLSDKIFLVSLNPGKPLEDFSAYGIYLLDEPGNHKLVYDDPEFSCWQPMPLRPRAKPAALTSAKDSALAKDNLAACVVTDIYRGMENVERGTVKYIRINEQVSRPWAARHFWGGDTLGSHHAAVGNTHLGLKVQHGIVPVEEDGSAYFLVPADKNIFLQALDDDFMEIQRERTYINYRPGEVRSCVGCHEKPKDTPYNTGGLDTALMALRRPPSTPGPQPGEVSGARPLHYPTDVQPILDRHCISCHSGEEPAADMDLSGEYTRLFNRSYENLINRRRGLLPLINEQDDRRMGEIVHYLPARSLGSHASKLIKMLREGHQDVQLSREEMVRLTTWVDSNAQYYGSWYGRRNVRYESHSNFRPTPTFAEVVCPHPPLREQDR